MGDPLSPISARSGATTISRAESAREWPHAYVPSVHDSESEQSFVDEDTSPPAAPSAPLAAAAAAAAAGPATVNTTQQQLPPRHEGSVFGAIKRAVAEAEGQ